MFGRGVLALTITVAAAAPASAQLAKVETSDVRVVYVDPTETFLVPYAVRTFLNSMRFQRSLFEFTPHEKVTVLLVDFADYGNAGASTVPRNSVQVQIAPSSYLWETMAPNERMSMLMNHELVHIAAMDGSTGRDRLFRGLFFGKVNPVADQPESILYFYLTSPRVAAPRWYQEGIAVFLDTWMDGGIGRAQGGYDEMVFRSMVRDQARFYDPLGLVSEGTKIDFQVEANSYLYGTRFMTWLAYQYSPEKLVQWVSRHPGSRPYYASQFRQVFGTSLESAWSDWIRFENTFQRENLDAIHKFPVTPSKDLSARALGSVSRAYYDEQSNKIYGAFDYPGVVAHVGSISVANAQMERFVDIKGPRLYQVASLAWDPTSRSLFYTADNATHRDLVKLDPRTGRTQLLQKGLRVGDLAFNRADSSLWGIRHLNGICSIVRIAPPYTDWTRIVSLPYGTVVYDLDVSADGTMVAASFGEVTGKQNVRVFSTATLLAGGTTTLAEFDFGSAVPNSFVFSPDGRYLYGSSYYTGTSNIFRYEIGTQQLEAVTNAETGFVRPIPLGGDELIVFRYTGEGFVPARISAVPLKDVSAITFLGERLVDKYPVLKTWAVGSPAGIPYDTMDKTTGVYGLAGGLQLESLYPIVQGYKNTGAVGLRVNFSDPLHLNGASVSASYSPAGAITDAERAHLHAEYVRYDWSANAAFNDADFYDLFGPTKTSRKGYAVSLGHTNTLIFDQPRLMQLKIQGQLAGNLDQLPEYQNIPVTVNRLLSLTANLSYSDLRSSLGHVDDEKGQTWSLVLRGDYVNSAVFTKLHGTYDVGFALPLPHSSVWLRSAAGFSPQKQDEPFANFFFGAFGNNYVDHGDEQRYRQYYSFPGAALNEIGGRNFARSMIEWTLPPIRFSRAGTPGAFLSWARPSVFVGGLLTNLDSAAVRRKAVTAGGQLDFRFTLLSQIDMTLSVGAAVASRNGSPLGREAMVSLKVLR
jgi:hypothetical protein